jgi:hypothetical protein
VGAATALVGGGAGTVAAGFTGALAGGAAAELAGVALGPEASRGRGASPGARGRKWLFSSGRGGAKASRTSGLMDTQAESAALAATIEIQRNKGGWRIVRRMYQTPASLSTGVAGAGGGGGARRASPGSAPSRAKRRT